MYPRTILIKQDRTVKINCPRCNGGQTVPVTVFKHSHQDKTIRCRDCDEVFAVRLEARCAFRKETRLKGGYTNITAGLPLAPMLVTDLSMQGFGFIDLSGQPPVENDKLRVTFNLDDPAGTLIKLQARVVATRGKEVGCLFIHTELYAKQLGLYILS